MFLAAVLLNALPVLLFKYFPSMDGPAHLHNARLIQELIFGNTDSIHSFLAFTEVPVPNWLGHVILTAALTMFPAFLAEKVLLVLYVVGLPYAFRLLIRTISPQNVEYSFFILPFCYSYLFALGFYNFSLALVLMFFTMAVWIRVDRASHPPAIPGRLIVLLILLYFAHLFVFGITLAVLVLYVVVDALQVGPRGGAWFGNWLSRMRPGLARLGLVSAIPLSYAILYHLRMPTAEHYTFIDKHELLEWLYTLRPLISYNTELEGVYTRRIFLVLVALALISFMVAIGRLRNRGKGAEGLVAPNGRLILFLGIVCLVFLFLYLTMPDGNEYAGYMSVRLGLLLMMFFIALLALFGSPKWITWSAIAFMLYCNVSRGYYHASVIRDQNLVALNCEKAGSHIPSGSIVYPVDRSGNWLGTHYSNYMGVNKPLVILENYEAGQGYFPLQWNVKELPDLWMGKLRLADLAGEPWAGGKCRPERQVDHILVLGDHDGFLQDAENDLVRETLTHYELIYTNNDCAVYRLAGTPLGPSDDGADGGQ